MVNSPLTGTALIVIGVTLILVGLLFVGSGFSSVQAAQYWEENVRPEHKSSRIDCEISKEMSDAPGGNCPPPAENPHSGGGLTLLGGVAVALVGGYATRRGTQ